VIAAHGDERIDEWYWLRERENPDVRAYLEAENAYTAAATAHLTPLREQLFGEIRGRVQETDASVPVCKNDWEYFTRTLEGHQYAIRCRRPAGTDALPDPLVAPGEPEGEHVILDENQLAQGHDYFALGGFSIDPAQERLAYSTDTTGAERYHLRVRNLATGSDLDDEIADVSYGLAWSQDGTTLFYTRPDEINRPFQVWRHRIGSESADDEMVLEETDERFYVGIGRFRTDRLIEIVVNSKNTSEVWLIDPDSPDAPPTIVTPRRDGVEYHVEHHVSATTDRLYVLTNEDAEDFRLFMTDRVTPERAAWSEVVPHRPGIRLDEVDAFADHLILSERTNGLTQLRVRRLSDHVEHLVELPDPVHTVELGATPEFDARVVRIDYTSLVRPPSAFAYDLDAHTLTLVKQAPVLGGYDATQYTSERAWARAADGTNIPMSIVYRRDLPPGPAPCLVYGYGSYEISIDPAFSIARLSLLDRGFVFAIAHVRGGGELGRQWYEQGRLTNKANTFTDFIACAKHLVDRGTTSAEMLVARGGSAGGLLIGAVANFAPELFAAMVAEVPFVDCLTTMLDPTLPLTVTEYDEWGNPTDDVDAYWRIKSYSPYDNVVARDYPALLVTAGLNDPRVQYWEPAKWVAKLRATKTGTRSLLLKTELGAGHGGPSGRYDAWRDEAFVLAFVIDQPGTD